MLDPREMVFKGLIYCGGVVDLFAFMFTKTWKPDCEKWAVSKRDIWRWKL